LKPGKVMAKRIAEEAFDKFAFDIELLDVRRRCEYANYFLILSGKNKVHLDALAEHLLEFASEKKAAVYGRDGSAASGWIVIDFGDLIAHLFLPEARSFYNLASVWGDAKPVDLQLNVKEADKKKKSKTT